MAEIYDLVAYRKQLEEEQEKTDPPEEVGPSLEEMAVVMVMSSDELFVELLARVEYGNSLRTDAVSTSTLITELTNRALHMELLCEMAANLSK
tara:strand:- start:1240 stop:1518 length:279 start_codon:yes stop_codon:yes gene_type:complete